jgi:putative hydrolase of the HAD superfamily
MPSPSEQASVPPRKIDVLLLDFGGVLAEEGFQQGLAAIGRLSGIDPDTMVQAGFDLIHRTGYVVGKAKESTFWDALRKEAGARGSDEALRREILTRFTVRPWMIELADQLKASGLTVGILSDQTQWLDELDARDHVFQHVHHVFNSFHTGLSKRDPAAFYSTLRNLGVDPGRVLFVDDHVGNVERAANQGLKTILYTDRKRFLQELALYVPLPRTVHPDPPASA